MKYDIFPMNISKHTWIVFFCFENELFSFILWKGEEFSPFGLEVGSIILLFLHFNARFLAKKKKKGTGN